MKTTHHRLLLVPIMLMAPGCLGGLLPQPPNVSSPNPSVVVRTGDVIVNNQSSNTNGNDAKAGSTTPTPTPTVTPTPSPSTTATPKAAIRSITLERYFWENGDLQFLAPREWSVTENATGITLKEERLDTQSGVYQPRLVGYFEPQATSGTIEEFTDSIVDNLRDRVSEFRLSGNIEVSPTMRMVTLSFLSDTKAKAALTVLTFFYNGNAYSFSYGFDPSDDRHYEYARRIHASIVDLNM